MIPRCADLLRAAEVSWAEEGNDSLGNTGYSSQVQRAQDVLACWWGGGKIQWTLRHRNEQGEGREDSRRIDQGLGMDMDMLWRHEFSHFSSKTVEEWMNAKVTAEIVESENWDDLSKETASFYLSPVTRPTTVSAELHRALQGFLNSRQKSPGCLH